MKYWAPINSPGGINGNDPYIDGNPAAGIQGSIPTFHAFEQPLRGLQRLVIKSGFTPDPGTDDMQIAQAIRSQGLNYFVDTGTADAIIVSTGNDPPLPAYTAGLPIHIKKIALANATTTPTARIDGLPAKVIGNIAGGLLNAGDLPASGFLSLMFDAVGDRFILMNGSGVGGSGGSSQTIIEAAAFPKRQIYNVAGTYTFTVPVGVNKVRARVWGGGGGGATALGSSAGASGGGGGGYSEKVCAVTPGQTITVTVGAGAPATSAGSSENGYNGGTSSFGAFCSATGGLGGQHPTGALAPGMATGTGGSGSGGDINLSGTYGSTGAGDAGTNAEKYGGLGGFAPLGGGGGYMSTGTSGAGLWPGGGGSGGGGTSATSSPGGAGAAGGVIVEWVSIP